MIVQTEKMPESGQFAALWVYNGQIWSRSLKWEGDNLVIFDIFENKWRDHQPALWFYPEDGIKPTFYQER